MTSKDPLTNTNLGTVSNPDSYDQKTVSLNSTNSTDLDSVHHESEAITIKPGTTLNNRFDILEVIGSGGMGTVYKAIDKRDIEAGNSCFIAIKVLNNECNNSEPLLKALYQETKKTQSLSHQNIVTVYDFDRVSNLVYMTMELIEGAPLGQIIKKNPLGIKLDEAVDMITQMGAALSYAHSKHIIHLDLKPNNIYFDRNKHIKILDFGIAQKLNSSLADIDEPCPPIGLTPSYASIELLNENTPSISDDIYAFACVCYELLSGQHPYNRERSDFALKKQLIPKKINSLNNKQWKALQGVLALQKQNRTESIEKFLQEFNTKKSNFKYFIMSGLLIFFLFFSYYLYQTTSALQKPTQQKQIPKPSKATAYSFPTAKKMLVKEQGEIQLWTDKKNYTIGDTITISFKVDRALYLQIFIINSIGKITTLFPNHYQANNLLEPNQIYQIPPKNAEFSLDISTPKGKDKIIALASSKPFPADLQAIDDIGEIINNDLIKSYIHFRTTYSIN